MGPSDLDELYDARILDHSRAPRHAERVAAPDAEASAVNPFCGDEAPRPVGARRGQDRAHRDPVGGVLDQQVIGLDAVGGGFGKVVW